MVKQMIMPPNKSVRQTHLSRLYFLSKGCKQVPLDIIDGKILWAHPDGYFLNARGQKVLHNYSPSHRTKGKLCHNGERGNLYPIMRHFGGKSCHTLICITFHGPRPAGYQCDHLNGCVTDYRAANLEWVTPAENCRRSRYLRVMRECGFDPTIFSASQLHEFFAIPFEEFKTVMYHHKNDE